MANAGARKGDGDGEREGDGAEAAVGVALDLAACLAGPPHQRQADLSRNISSVKINFLE